MQKFIGILKDVWRETCRNIDIKESAANVAQMLEKHIPLEQLYILMLSSQEHEHPCLETLCIGIEKNQDFVPKAHIECAPSAIKELMKWGKTGELIHFSKKTDLHQKFSFLLPPEKQTDALAGPLISSQKFAGILVILSKPDCPFEPRHLEMMRILLEPFSAALENARMLHKLAVQREAAEADKRSLLTKFSRDKMEDTIIGNNTGLRSVIERISLVAHSDAPVLIFGETGTGKELISREIHKRSLRSSGPFIRVNCGAIPHALIDSQLFGHERGAFTGANETRKGWFERADSGTLFLDEIGELSPDAQVRLLRIIQDGWLERIGSSHPVHVDVRIVMATHRDLATMVAEGNFREDLWYRIAVFPIVLPPLRERIEDIPALARHFAKRAAIRFGLPVIMPTEKDLAIFASYHWPGNIRELATVINRAALIGNGKSLEVTAAIGLENISKAPYSTVINNEPANEHTPGGISSLDEAMKKHIQSALMHTKGRIEGPYGAAALLKINPHTLRARMRKLKIDWQKFRGL